MAAFQFQLFGDFVRRLAEGHFNLGADTLKVLLSATRPPPAAAVLADVSELPAGNGYPAGGASATTISSGRSGDCPYSLVLAGVTFFASGGPVGPFRYAVLYDDTAIEDDLIGFWDYGRDVTLSPGEGFVVDLPNYPGVITLA